MLIYNCLVTRTKNNGDVVCKSYELVEVQLVESGTDPDVPLSAYMATFTGSFVFVGLFYILGMKVRTVLRIFK